MHRAVADPTDRGHDACVVERAEALATRGAITLILHEPIDDATLFAFVGGLDVSVMANVWGTHSGWIEMCHDLGVRVVAPNIGFYGEQHAPVLYDLAGRGDEAEDGDAASEDATVDARRAPAPPRGTKVDGIRRWGRRSRDGPGAPCTTAIFVHIRDSWTRLRILSTFGHTARLNAATPGTTT